MTSTSEPSLLWKSVWQVACYILGVMLVGTWVWVWNTNNEIHDLRNSLLRLPEVMLRADANRSINELNSNRIGKLEEGLVHGRSDWEDLRKQDHELRAAIDNIVDALQQLRIEQTRLGERSGAGGPR